MKTLYYIGGSIIHSLKQKRLRSNQANTKHSWKHWIVFSHMKPQQNHLHAKHSHSSVRGVVAAELHKTFCCRSTVFVRGQFQIKVVLWSVLQWPVCQTASMTGHWSQLSIKSAMMCRRMRRAKNQFLKECWSSFSKSEFTTDVKFSWMSTETKNRFPKSKKASEWIWKNLERTAIKNKHD